MTATEQGELLRVDRLSKTFSINAGMFSKPLQLKALQDISFSINRGETLGIVGESGCGKSTLGRCILQLLKPDEGRVLWLGTDIAALPGEQMRKRRRELQIIFQDPQASLNPRMTVGEIVADPLKALMPELNAAQRRTRVMEMMEAVGLQPEMINRYPHEFSGGQAQRIGIARALITEPKLIVCDEPVSALDVSVQAQILNLLKDLQRERGLSYLFVSHDLNVVRYIADRVCVMYLGEIVEEAPTEELFTNPTHPYTKGLLDAIPQFDSVRKVSERAGLRGEVADPSNMPSGCRFHPRCPTAVPEAAQVVPVLTEFRPGHSVAACPCFAASVGLPAATAGREV